MCYDANPMFYFGSASFLNQVSLNHSFRSHFFPFSDYYDYTYPAALGSLHTGDSGN